MDLQETNRIQFQDIINNIISFVVFSAQTCVLLFFSLFIYFYYVVFNLSLAINDSPIPAIFPTTGHHILCCFC